MPRSDLELPESCSGSSLSQLVTAAHKMQASTAGENRWSLNYRASSRWMAGPWGPLLQKPPELFQERGLSESQMENCGRYSPFGSCLSMALKLPSCFPHLLPPPLVKPQCRGRGCHLLMVPGIVNLQAVRDVAVFIQKWGPYFSQLLILVYFLGLKASSLSPRVH